MGTVFFFAWLLGNPGEAQEKEESDIADANEFVNGQFADGDQMAKMGFTPREHQEIEELDELEEESRLFRFGFWRRN